MAPKIIDLRKPDPCPSCAAAQLRFPDTLFNPANLAAVNRISTLTKGRFQWHTHLGSTLGIRRAMHSFLIYVRLGRAGLTVTETPEFSDIETAVKHVETVWKPLAEEEYTRRGL